MKGRTAFLLLLAIAGMSAGCGEEQKALISTLMDSDTSNRITVMTWNVYVGTDVDAVLAAENPEQVPQLVAEAFQTLLATNFAERARAMAAQIAKWQPHLVGLQEISVIRIQSPGDTIIGGTVPATEVRFDYLKILLDALRDRGLNYRVAGQVQNADVEVPMVVNLNPLAFDDVRLTDFDVVLARSDVKISRVTTANYAATLPVESLGIKIPRGYVAVDATIGGKTYRFVNTHLEPGFIPVQMAQAEELVVTLQDEGLPVILVGDLNTPAPDGTTYQFLGAQGYVDMWGRNLEHVSSGFTCCHDADLSNPTVNLEKRIDLILVRNPPVPQAKSAVGSVQATVVGDELSNRTTSGLWPSDHAGVVAQLLIP